jgi:hypothetical protein
MPIVLSLSAGKLLLLSADVPTATIHALTHPQFSSLLHH